MKPGEKSSIKLMDENNSIISDPKIIGNIFNDHFSTLGAKVQQKITHEQGDFREYLKKKGTDNKMIIYPEDHSFFLSPTIPDEMKKLFISSILLIHGSKWHSGFHLKSIQRFFRLLAI